MGGPKANGPLPSVRFVGHLRPDGVERRLSAFGETCGDGCRRSWTHPALHISYSHATEPVPPCEGFEIDVLFVFPSETFAIAISDYERPYENPIGVKAGDLVRPITDGSMETDFMGWTWCVGPDGRAGWTPDSWCQPVGEHWQVSRDFSALELTVRKGDRLRLLYSESGFLFCERNAGERAWVPDAVMALAD